MSPPNKAANKFQRNPHQKHDEAKDIRRAHEHGGRVEVLLPSLGKYAGDVETLVAFAGRELAGSHLKDAADLLRAAEHLCFGLLAASKPDANVPPALAESVEQEFQHKLENAEEYQENSEPLDNIFQKVLADAKRAFQNAAYRKALELARAAEAIAHVHLHDEEDS